ncbi:protein kinase domain-containing protein [Halorubrum ezzemoulense]|uniref:protein kinase domain-containing protein n=1 Tax=Halorubrum ezzemoulense TaxID=337243 RepID=UPI00232CB0C4|nr:PQQ-binding-like beta-propeller repeat protein [Halorubrum ezzemoulense]MDB2242727.1 PQQ-binding-like beta-propeller repeat protein [Halorubrum ezzemoulense]
MDGGVKLSRRDFLKTAVTTTGTIGLASGQVTAESGQWPTFGHDSGNRRYNPDADLAGNSATEQWVLSVGTPTRSDVVVVNEIVYFTDSSGITYRVTPNGNTSTYRVGERAESEENGGSTPAPAIVENQLYVGGLNSTVNAINLDTEETVWSYETEGRVSAPPTVRDGEIYAGCDQGVVYALDRESGDERWQYQTGDTITTAACFIDTTLIIATQSGDIHAVETASEEGETIIEMDGEIHAAPVAGPSQAYVASDQGELRSITLNPTETQWTQEFDSSVVGTPTLTSDELHVGTVDGSLYALDLISGEINWETTVRGGIQTGLAIAAEVLLIGTDTGRIHAFDLADKSQLWEFNAGTPISTPVSVAGDLLYFGTEDGSIYAISSEAGPLYTVQSAASETARGASAAVPFDASPLAVAAGGLGGIGGMVGLGYAGFRTLRRRASRGTDTAGKRENKSTAAKGDAEPIRSESVSGITSDVVINDISYEDIKRERQIGSGGSANVYEATVNIDGTKHTVALKTPRVNDSDTVDISTISDFAEEAEVWEGIDEHERIVTVHDWGEEPLPWIAMEYMQGGTLNENKQSLDRDNIFTELEGLCEGLHHAHRHGITHTDIKPENILFTESGEHGVGKLSDWGLANVLLDHSMSVYGLTPTYSAPEQLQPEAYGGTDDRTDIYQLGIVAYELLVGEVPYSGESHGGVVSAILNSEPSDPTEINPDLPSEIDDVLLTAIAESKENRYETALHFRDDLRRVYHTL